MTVSDASPCAARSRRVADLLLQIEAVHFRPNQPFQLASGNPSPVYVDCRRIISFPETRSEIVGFLAEMIERSLPSDPPFDCVAGGETAGIPFAAFVADRMGLPMAYIRKKPKGYGRNAQIEGIIEKGANILLIEDLATDGGSKLRFVDAIRSAGAVCGHTAVILGYGIFHQKERSLAEAGLNLHRLCGLRDVFDSAIRLGLINAGEAASIREFIEDPLSWQNRNRLEA